MPRLSAISLIVLTGSKLKRIVLRLKSASYFLCFCITM
ncbi:related to transposase (partial length) [Desulfotalea psychrophila LSv54]|uniref:Related to transposase (Partial length) n=1 Tax=Desulfotalea psychrophila (strain LSv54 / DSM 12343) TaxID=177439 RepID=Q6AIB7_DESPS|nr:related to transposase (partial length) [Desulfotalea psychrophila LSv54]